MIQPPLDPIAQIALLLIFIVIVLVLVGAVVNLIGTVHNISTQLFKHLVQHERRQRGKKVE